MVYFNYYIYLEQCSLVWKIHEIVMKILSEMFYVADKILGLRQFYGNTITTFKFSKDLPFPFPCPSLRPILMPHSGDNSAMHFLLSFRSFEEEEEEKTLYFVSFFAFIFRVFPQHEFYRFPRLSLLLICLVPAGDDGEERGSRWPGKELRTGVSLPMQAKETQQTLIISPKTKAASELLQ